MIIGAITRTDIMRARHEDIAWTREAVTDRISKRPHARNLKNILRERLPARIESLLQEIGAAADNMGVAAYAIGGFVRDLLLGVENYDVDIVIEGDGISFAKNFAAAAGARVRSHQRFGTAVIIFPDGFKMDVATARTEYYEYPTALPTVELSSIRKDLYRRDFTINTLAIKLNKKDFGYLIDFFGGQRDLKEKSVRVLHNLSFIEDPTRIYRAIRFEQRLGFKIARHTQSLIRGATKIDLFHRLAGRRLFTELVLLLSEEEPAKPISRLAEFDLLRFIHPSLQWDDTTATLFVNTKKEAEFLVDRLNDNGYPCRVISGDVDQKRRLRILEDFKAGKLPMLIATDVASRGLHIDAVSHVINYDLPQDCEDYVHRIGRTARAGAEGKAISLADEEGAFYIEAIQEYIREKIPVEWAGDEMFVHNYVRSKPRPKEAMPARKPSRPRSFRGHHT